MRGTDLQPDSEAHPNQVIRSLALEALSNAPSNAPTDVRDAVCMLQKHVRPPAISVARFGDQVRGKRPVLSPFLISSPQSRAPNALSVQGSFWFLPPNEMAGDVKLVYFAGHTFVHDARSADENILLFCKALSLCRLSRLVSAILLGEIHQSNHIR
jgi:hypothetical protein